MSLKSCFDESWHFRLMVMESNLNLQGSARTGSSNLIHSLARSISGYRIHLPLEPFKAVCTVHLFVSLILSSEDE